MNDFLLRLLMCQNVIFIGSSGRRMMGGGRSIFMTLRLVEQIYIIDSENRQKVALVNRCLKT